MTRWGLWELRWNMRSLLAYGAIALLLATAPIIAAALDDRGLPGPPIVLGLLALAAVAAAYAVYTTLPTPRRARALRKVAAGLEMPFARRFPPLEGMDGLPFMRLTPIGNRYIASGFAGERAGRQIAVFSRSYTFDEYEATVWRTCAATEVPMDAPLLRVARHQGLTGQSSPRAYATGMHLHRLESEAFDRRWRVETRDRRFANALLDQRMMAWLMSVGDYGFEAGGSWVMADTPREDLASIERLIDALGGFVAHLPRAALSIYAPV